MIFELLGKGKEAAKTCKELARILNLSTRKTTEIIQKERKKGLPICATTTDTPGYYIPESRAEMWDYCQRLKHRAKEIEHTRSACMRSMAKLPR